MTSGNEYQHYPVVRVLFYSLSLGNLHPPRICSILAMNECINMIGMLPLMDISTLAFNCLYLWVCPNGGKITEFRNNQLSRIRVLVAILIYEYIYFIHNVRIFNTFFVACIYRKTDQIKLKLSKY